MKRSSLLAAGAALAAGASAALLGADYAIYRTWFHRTAQPEVLTTDEWERTVPYGAQMHADAAALAAAPYEPVQITADDGVPLAARCYHHADGAPVAIIFHGYKGFARRDGMGGYTLCKKLGYNVLLPDQRAHGASGGQSITLGVKERYDCRAWAYWAYQHFGPDTPLFLMGVSMGAATVLLAAGLDLPPTVRGIMADCGYTSPREVIHQYLPRYLPGLPVGPVYAVGRLGTRLFGHFDPEDADCRAAGAGRRRRRLCGGPRAVGAQSAGARRPARGARGRGRSRAAAQARGAGAADGAVPRLLPAVCRQLPGRAVPAHRRARHAHAVGVLQPQDRHAGVQPAAVPGAAARAGIRGGA